VAYLGVVISENGGRLLRLNMGNATGEGAAAFLHRQAGLFPLWFSCPRAESAPVLWQDSIAITTSQPSLIVTLRNAAPQLFSPALLWLRWRISAAGGGMVALAQRISNACWLSPQ
jgi:hypothetical protein